MKVLGDSVQPAQITIPVSNKGLCYTVWHQEESTAIADICWSTRQQKN